MYKYKAFISYSHRDRKWADWLHKRLETYVFPKHIPSLKTRSLKPIFRDREDLSVSSDLSRNIRDALLQSECLIVLCSPYAAQSQWVNKEIREFRRLNPQAEIFPIIVGGEPHAEQRGLTPEQECFPEALRFTSEPSAPDNTNQIEPLAADLRKDKDGKQLGLAKLIAGMCGISPNDLIQRDLQRARKRMIAVTSGASLIVLALSLLTVSTLIARDAAEQNARIAEEQRMLAETRRAEAEGLIEFMLGDLRHELEPVGRLSLLTNVADRAMSYYEKVDEDLSNCVSASGAARAQYLHTRIAVSQNNYPVARKSSDDALNLLEAMAEKCGHIEQFVTNYAHAQQWSAELDRIIENPESSGTRPFDPDILAKYESARSNLLAYAAQNPSSLNIILEQVDADILVGKYYYGTERIKAALGEFKAAQKKLQDKYDQLELADNLTLSSSPYLIADKYADVLSWISGAYESLSRLEDAALVLQEARKIYTDLLSATEGAGENWKARFDVMGIDYALARIHYKQGQQKKAIETLKTLETDIELLVKQDPANQSWRELQDKIKSSRSALEP